MLKALGQHIWLLLTFRHTSEGLKTALMPCVLIFSLATFLQFVRWQLVAHLDFNIFAYIVSLLLFVYFYKKFTSTLANIYFLGSIGVDLIAIVLALGGVISIDSGFFVIWEITIFMCAAIRFFALRKNEKKDVNDKK